VKNRFTSFDEAAREFAGRDFAHRPYQLGGNFVTAVWHKGAGPTEPITLRGDRKQLKPIHRISVDVIVVPAPEQALSTSLTAEVVEADPEKWCVQLHFRQGNGHMVTSEGSSFPARLQALQLRLQAMFWPKLTDQDRRRIVEQLFSVSNR
jgi:hypothetical protein